MNHRSLAFRLAAWYVPLLGVMFILVAAAVFAGMQHYLEESWSESLQRRGTQVEEILLREPGDATAAAIVAQIRTRVAPEFISRFLRVTRAPGAEIFRSAWPLNGSFDPNAVPPFDGAWPRDAVSYRSRTAAGQVLMISTKSVEAPSGRYLVEIGVATEPIDELRKQVLVVLGLLVPVLLACAAAVGYLLVGRALRPVDELSRTAAKISLLDLDATLPVVPSGDALERLARSFNSLIGRLRESLQTSRRFLADASHELRTPLTVIKGELQEISRMPQIDRDARNERIGSVLEEVARLEHMVKGLIDLSRLDAGEVKGPWIDVDLAELVVGTAEQMRLMAEDRGIALELSGARPVVVHADRQQLKQVLVNLLDNAIRFTPRGGVVRIVTQAAGEGAVLEVIDNGMGIPADALPHIFDRFYRSDEARSRDDGGVGLGLAIVKSICAAQGAEVAVESVQGGGSRFVVRFARRF